VRHFVAPTISCIQLVVVYNMLCPEGAATFCRS